MKVLKPGFYIDRKNTIWLVYPNNTRYFLTQWWFTGKKWVWLKSYSTYLESTQSRYLGV